VLNPHRATGAGARFDDQRLHLARIDDGIHQLYDLSGRLEPGALGALDLQLWRRSARRGGRTDA
jgi:hypothetical protein